MRTEDLRNPKHPLRRPEDYRADGTRRRRWSFPERKYRLSYRRHPLATAASTAAAILAATAISYGTTHVDSIFASNPALNNSGWGSCATPITWTTDMRNVPAQLKPAIRGEISRSFASWSGSSGYVFRDGGEVIVTFDDAQSLVIPVVDMSRNISLYFLPESQSQMLTKTVVGLAGPSKVYTDTREIVGGYAAFSTDYISKAQPRQRTALFTHEIGHALGLADSDDSGNVMYRFVNKRTMISSGDTYGIQAIVKPCTKE